MSETTKYFEQAIGRWLEQEKEKDELFARQVETSGKTLEGCCNYIISQVKASKQCGYADEEIYGMARHFFDEADVKDPGTQSVSRIVVPGHIDLTESEKAEAMEAAKKQYLAQIEAEEKAKAEREREKERERLQALKEKKAKETAVQGDLFGF